MTPMALSDRLARVTDSAPVLRRRCGWCAGKPAIDGLGPIPVGVPASDGLCLSCEARLHADLDAHA